MWIAHRVFGGIFCELDRQREDVRYLETIFELAALLHDVGHCAFSHSIENVLINDEPFFYTLRELVENWEDEDLRRFLRTYSEAHADEPETDREPVSHEQLGLLFVAKILREPRVAEVCRQHLSAEPGDVLRDVHALLDDHLSYSEHFSASAEYLRSKVEGLNGVPSERFPKDLQEIFHILISGTLDVDRLDYLVRDSFYLGTPYGTCDVEVLVGGLGLAELKGRTVLTLAERAGHALDDMLWSRYQMFLQVYNHKTNVALNAMLREALPEAIKDTQVGFKRPVTFEDFVEFTDDHVMSSIFSVCSRYGHKDTIYGKALVHRVFPLHVGTRDLSGPLSAEQKQELQAEKAVELGWDPTAADEVIVSEAVSELIKPGPLPYLVSHSKGTDRTSLEPFDNRSAMLRDIKSERLPRLHRRLHFFIDRGDGRIES